MAKKAEKTHGKPTQEAKGQPTQPGRVLDLKPGVYCDGHPLDEVQYLECKLILKPDRFTSAKVFQEYGELVGRAAKAFGIGFSTKGVVRNGIFGQTEVIGLLLHYSQSILSPPLHHIDFAQVYVAEPIVRI